MRKDRFNQFRCTLILAICSTKSPIRIFDWEIKKKKKNQQFFSAGSAESVDLDNKGSSGALFSGLNAHKDMKN